MATTTATYVLTAEDRTRAGTESAGRNFRQLGDGVNVVKGVFTAFAAVTASLGIARVFREAVDAVAEFEKSNNRLDAVMKATGETVGFTRQQLEGMVVAMERETIFSQNEMRDATAVMATFKSVQGETFEQGIRLAADMSAVMDQSLKSSVVKLGKALEDPVRGLSSMREVGVSFTAQQEEMIKTLAESGNKLEAQGLILEALEGQFGGTAGKLKEGVHGALIATDQAWTNMLVTMGQTGPTKILVSSSLLSLANVFDAVRESIENAQKELDKSTFFDGKLRQKLDTNPSASAEFGSSEIKSGMSVEEVQAIGREEAARRDAKVAAEKLQRDKANETQAKEMAAAEKERMAEATFQSRLFADEQVRNIKAQADAMNALAESEAADLTQRLEIFDVLAEIAADEDERRADVADRGEEIARRELEILARKGQALSDSLASESQLLRTSYNQKQEIIDAAEAAGFEITGGWQKQRFLVVKQFEEQTTSLVDADIKKRFGIANVYRKLDKDSAQFFMGQMSQLMEGNSRKMFAIGRAAAIGETIIQTYRAAQGAFASLVNIPIVGPVLGAAAAAAAVVAGLARVQAIRGTQFGGGAVAVPTFSASPTTGLPTSFGPSNATQETPSAEREVKQTRTMHLTLISDSGMVSTQWIRDYLFPEIQEALGDGLTLTVN